MIVADDYQVQIIFNFYFCSHDVGSGTVEKRSNEKLAMNQWHKISISRRGNTADFNVRTTTARSRRSVTPSSILNVDDRVYLGGLDARKERYGHWISQCLCTNSIAVEFW